MLRTAAKRAFLLRAAVPRAAHSRLSSLAQSSSSQMDTSLPPPETPYYADSTPSSDEQTRRHRKRPTFGYQEEQARVLQASLRNVKTLGWSEAAMIAGAKEVGVSPSIVGSFPRKGAALVEGSPGSKQGLDAAYAGVRVVFFDLTTYSYFMDGCLQKLIDRIDSGDLNDLIPSERISKLVRVRLEMQAPYISKWPEALAIQAQPMNVPSSFKQRAMLMDEIWHAVGDESSDVDWYVKRTILGGIYSTTEVYMLTDSSPEFRDTWAFLDNRVKDAFDLNKTMQEAQYLAEAVGAGMGSSLQGFVKRVMQG